MARHFTYRLDLTGNTVSSNFSTLLAENAGWGVYGTLLVNTTLQSFADASDTFDLYISSRFRHQRRAGTDSAIFFSDIYKLARISWTNAHNGGTGTWAVPIGLPFEARSPVSFASPPAENAPLNISVFDDVYLEGVFSGPTPGIKLEAFLTLKG